MVNETNHDDAMLDRNLALVGVRLRLPDEPSADQQARWKLPVAQSRRMRRLYGVVRMNRHRWLTISGVGGAIAAAVVLTAFLGTRSHPSTVRAETIFQELHNALGQAFQLTFENLSLDGVRSNGTLIVLDNPPAAGGGPSTDRPHGMYMEARLQGKSNSPSDGLDVQATLSFVGENNDWAYVKTQNVPAGLTDGNPIFGWLAGLAGNGLLVELPNGPVQSTTTNPINPPAPPTTTTTTSSFGGITTTVTQSTQTSYTMHPTMTFSVGVGNGANDTPTTEQVQQMTQQAVQNAQNGDGHHLSLQISTDDGPLGPIVQRLVTGQASTADFQQIADHLQASADSVSVEQVEPGLHVLTATGLDTDSNGDGNVPGGATLKVAYRENDGVQWAEIEHIGPSEGRVRFERADVQATDVRFDRQRFASNPAVRRLDLSDWSSLFGLVGNAGSPPANP